MTFGLFSFSNKIPWKYQRTQFHQIFLKIKAFLLKLIRHKADSFSAKTRVICNLGEHLKRYSLSKNWHHDELYLETDQITNQAQNSRSLKQSKSKLHFQSERFMAWSSTKIIYGHRYLVWLLIKKLCCCLAKKILFFFFIILHFINFFSIHTWEYLQ